MPAATDIFARPKIFDKPKFQRPPKVAVPKAEGSVRAPVIPTDEQLPEEIQGVPIGSKEEARVALALDTLQYRYAYQKQVMGGRRLRGGQVLDFLVYTKPLPTPLLVQGSYWHTGQHADQLDTQRINASFRGKYRPVVEIWDYQATSVADALAFLRKHLPA